MNHANPVLKAGDLTSSELWRLLETLSFPEGETTRCWLEAPDGWALDFWQGTEGGVLWNEAGRAPEDQAVSGVLERVTFGRIFAPSGELKWRVLPALGEQCCRTVFLGRDWGSSTLEEIPCRDELSVLSSDRAIYPLWGQQTSNTPGEWIDFRIPHRLRYPVESVAPANGRVIAKAQVEIWKDKRGEPQFIRLCDLQAKWEE